MLALYDAFACSARSDRLTSGVIDRATALRARYGFKTPDALHHACAIDAGADAFVTGDANLARCWENAVEVMSVLSPP